MENFYNYIRFIYRYIFFIFKNLNLFMSIINKNNTNNNYKSLINRDTLWIYNHLHMDKSTEKCQANILETILFENKIQPRPYLWLLTSKSGYIIKKKEENMSFRNVYKF